MVLTTLGNILWLVLCGVWMSILYFIAGVVGIVFIITIPFGLQAFKLANYVLWPFGRTVIRKEGSSGLWALIGNIVWIILDGWWLAVAHLLLALIFFVTVVGIPFAIANVKLARLALTPFGLTVVEGTGPRGDAVMSVSQLGPGAGTSGV